MWAWARLRCRKRRRIAWVAWLLWALPGTAMAQQAIGEARIYATERVVIGGSTFGSTSPIQVIGLPNLAGTIATVDGSGNIGLAATGTATISAILSATGAVTLGDATADDITVNGRLASGLTWKTDNTNDIGASGANRARDFFLARNASIGGTLGVTGTSTLAALSATTGTFSSTLGVTGAATFSNNTGATSFTSRTTGWRVTSAGDADVRSLFVDNLSARTFTADLEQVIVGSQRVTKSSSTISQAFTCPAAAGTATLWVDDIPSAPNLRVFASGDAVSIRNFSRTDGDSDGNLDLTVSDCVGVVTSYADGTAGNDGQQSWTFTRNSGGNAGSMAGATVVPVKTIALDYGTTGMGFAEVSAVDGAEGQNAPYYQLATWATSPTSGNFTVRCRLGNLSGAYNYGAGSGVFGLACGDPSATNVTMDSTNGFRVRSGTTDKFKADTSGNLSLTGDLSVGTSGVIRSGATALDTATGYWFAYNAGTPQLRIGTMSGSTLTKGIRWDGSGLTVISDYFTADANGVAIPARVGGGLLPSNGLRFTGSSLAGDPPGLYSYESGSARTTTVRNSTTGTGTTSAELYASNSGGAAYVLANAVTGNYQVQMAAQTRALITGGDFTTTGSYVELIDNQARIDRVGNVSGTYAFWLDTSNRYLALNSSAAPTEPLDVYGKNNVFTVRIVGTSTAGQSYGSLTDAGTNSSDWTARWRSAAGTEYFAIRGDGNVGVGTVSPAAKLDVAGTVNATGFSASGTAGISFGPVNPTTCSSITVTNGLITAKAGC